MKKMKTLFLTLAIGLTCAAAATMASCGKDNTEPDWFASESQESAVSVRFAEKQAEAYQYETVQVSCTTQGTTEAVVYTSSDETMATVDQNGLVTVYGKTGEAVITATVEGVTDTCTVTIKESPYSPQIVASTTTFTIEQGDTIEFEVDTNWNNVPVAETVKYDVSFAEDSLASQATLAVDGNTISVTGNAVETVHVMVSATVRGIYTSEIFTVNVTKAALKIQSSSEFFMPVSGNYAATVSTTDKYGDVSNSLPLDFVVLRGQEVCEDAQITWTVDGESVDLQNGTLFGKSRGEATLTGTVTVEGETATATVQCSVVAPTIPLSQTAVIEVADLQLLKIEEDLEGTVLSVELHGEEIHNRIRGNTIQLSKDKFPKKASQLGKQQLSLVTDIVTYIMDVEIYTMIINDADELDQMATVANTGETEYSSRLKTEVNSEYYDGYFILGNDIDYNRTIQSMTDTGKVYLIQGLWNDNTRGFRGIFDGCGYNIDGVTVGKNKGGNNESGGIFGYVGTGGIVRNVSFTNASVLVNNGFICALGEGLIENVSISYKQLGGDRATLNLSSDPRTMGSFFSFKAGGKATVRNCLVDASGATIHLEKAVVASGVNYNLKLATAAVNVENVVVITADETVQKVSGADIVYYSYEDIANDPKALADFDPTIWTKVSGVPMFVKQAESLDTNKDVQFINTDSTLLAGFSMAVQVDNPYTKIEISETAGITYKNSILTATEEAFGQTVTITATSLFNPEKIATHTVYIDSYGKTVDAPVSENPVVYIQDPKLVIGDNTWMGEENYVYVGKDIVASGATEIVLDTDKLSFGEQDVTIVTVKDGQREHFNITLDVTYKKADIANSRIAQSSIFATDKGTALVDNADLEGVTAPEGFEKVQRVDSSTGWTKSVLTSQYFNNANYGTFSDIYFAIKLINGRYVFQGAEFLSSEWVYFHCTQTSKDKWAVEATVEGQVYTTQYNVDGLIGHTGNSQSVNSIGALLFRNGWDDGFLIYHLSNPVGAVSIYATEVRGVAYPTEGTKVIDSALDGATAVSDIYLPGGYESVSKLTSFTKGSFAKDDLTTLGYEKYSFMMMISSNLSIPELYSEMDTTKYKNVVQVQVNSFFTVEVTKTETGWGVYMGITPSYNKVEGGWVQPSGYGYTFTSTGNTLSEIFGQWSGWSGVTVWTTEVRGM